MAYANTTFSTLKALLKERAGGQDNFWTDFEFGFAINEALNVWQLLVGEFSAVATFSSASIAGEIEDLYFPASAGSDLDVPGGSTQAPLPLSVWRVATNSTTTNTAVLLSYGKLIQASLPELDYGYPGWRTGTATTPEYWVPAGLNKIIFYPRPNVDLYLNYFSGDQFLVAEADYVQLGDEELNRILDYAVWQLNVKSGTEEAFNTTKPLRELFLLAANLRNQKLRGSQLYKNFMGDDRGEQQPNRDASEQKGGR